MNFIRFIFTFCVLFMIMSAIAVVIVTTHRREVQKRLKKRETSRVSDDAIAYLPQDVSVLGLNHQVVVLLNNGGINTVQDLVNSSRDALLEIKGIKEGRADLIIEKLNATGLRFGLDGSGYPVDSEDIPFDEFYESPIYGAFEELTAFWEKIGKTCAKKA